MSIEFFVVLGFVLLAAGVFIASSETQAKGTKTLNNIALARNVLDSEVAAINYAYLSGSGSRITQTFFVPAGVSCMNWDAAAQKLYCTVAGHTSFVNSEAIERPVTISVNGTSDCYKTGWLKTVTENTDGATIAITCTR